MEENSFAGKQNNGNGYNISFDFNVESKIELINRSDLGKRKHVCGVCEAEGDFQEWECSEQYFGLGDKFVYFVCGKCHTLQISEKPKNLDRYYPSNYYSFIQPVIEPVRLGAVRDTRMILDVGCGAGTWLCFLATIGCENLFGCDPMIAKDIEYSNGVKIKKCELHEMDGGYDVIHMNHVFEHLTEPKNIFKTLDRLLKREKGESPEDPKIEINMPVFPNLAFDIYGPYWYQLDAPRHFFIYSIDTVCKLAEEYGFVLSSLVYDDSVAQFNISHMYQHGVPFYVHQQRFEFDSLFADLRKQQPFMTALAKFAALQGRSDSANLTFIRK
jgi:SAM-dependent methyltransferase